MWTGPRREARVAARQGVRFFPVVGWAERGGGLARGPGNSVPRFHIVWGTGPGAVARSSAAPRSGVDFRFRHRVTSWS